MTSAGTVVELDLTRADYWLARHSCDTTSLREAAVALRALRPAIRSAGRLHEWDEVARNTGLDAIVWAVLLSASKHPPYVIGPAVDALASRTDANPLAAVRRAHAAASRRLAGGHATRAPATPALPQAAATPPVDAPLTEPILTEARALRTTLALADRAAYDAQRTGRTRPLLLALQDIAAATLSYLEVTPVPRTDLPLTEAARRVLARALAAAEVAAPVPY